MSRVRTTYNVQGLDSLPWDAFFSDPPAAQDQLPAASDPSVTETDTDTIPQNKIIPATTQTAQKPASAADGSLEHITRNPHLDEATKRLRDHEAACRQFDERINRVAQTLKHVEQENNEKRGCASPSTPSRRTLKRRRVAYEGSPFGPPSPKRPRNAPPHFEEFLKELRRERTTFYRSIVLAKEYEAEERRAFQDTLLAEVRDVRISLERICDMMAGKRADYLVKNDII